MPGPQYERGEKGRNMEEKEGEERKGRGEEGR